MLAARSERADCTPRMANKLKEIDKKHPVGIAIAGCDPLLAL